MMTTVHTCTGVYCTLHLIDYSIISFLLTTFYCLVTNMRYAKQKQPGAVKKVVAKQSRINATTEYDW